MAFWEGVIAGYGIAIPVGAIAILIVDTALRLGFVHGFMAGAGAASADLLFATLAALAGPLLLTLLRPAAGILQIASGLVLIALGGWGLWKLWHPSAPAAAAPDQPTPTNRAWGTYGQFLGLTLLNPLTIAYFTSLILGGAGSQLTTWAGRAFFVLGAGAASLSWQSLLAGFGAFARQRLSARWQWGLSAAGNGIVIALGVRILVRLWTGG